MTSNIESLPVAVIGAGPVGLAAAAHVPNVALKLGCWKQATEWPITSATLRT
jgi:cation diffusion facilitator CzcD-associated flavoprotein CzcO